MQVCVLQLGYIASDILPWRNKACKYVNIYL